MRALLLVVLLLSSFNVRAATFGDFFIDPNVGVGFNSIQGTVMRFGLDLGVYIDQNFYAGVAGYYASGDHPEHDRELGAGPFVGYVYPLLRSLTLNLREDVDYVDARVPIYVGNSAEYDSHENHHGIESGTTLGLHLSFTPNLGLSVGYRLAVGLTNSDIARGRSGLFFGLSIGI